MSLQNRRIAERSRNLGLDFRHHLQRELERRKELDRGYSLRKFAASLGEDPSALSRILSGKSPAGPRVIRKLGGALLLGPDEINDFLRLEKSKRTRESIGQLTSRPRSAMAADFQPIQADQFRVISDWQHFAILELMQLKSFKPEKLWIAKTLGISLAEVSLAIERLIRVGLLDVDQDGRWTDLTQGWSTNIAQPFFDPGHRRLQKQILEKAIFALESIPVSRRDQSSITMAFPQSRMSEAKNWIREFRRKFNQEFGQGDDRDSVYQLCLSFFPVTQTQEIK